MSAVWVEFGDKTEYHPFVLTEDAVSFAKYEADKESSTFVAVITVDQDGDMNYLCQDVFKGNKDGSRNALEFAQQICFRRIEDVDERYPGWWCLRCEGQ